MSNVDTTLRTAVGKLTEALPGDLNATPRLVVTDSESLAGIAFCVDHQLPRNEEHEYSACDNCEVIDCKYRQLAELVHALLLAREPIAAWLDGAARAYGDFTESHGPDVAERIVYDALALAHVIKGGAA